MRPTEMVTLCDWVQAIKPAQKMTEETPDAWYAVFGRLDFEQAKQAVLAIAARESWVEPHAIVAEVKRQRAKPLETVDTAMLVPDADPDDPEAYLRALRDGAFRRDTPALTSGQRDVAALVSGTFRTPEDEKPRRRFFGRRPAIRPASSQPGE